MINTLPFAIFPVKHQRLFTFSPCVQTILFFFFFYPPVQHKNIAVRREREVD